MALRTNSFMLVMVLECALGLAQQAPSPREVDREVRMVDPSVVHRPIREGEIRLTRRTPPSPDEAPPGTLRKGSAEAAKREAFLLEETAKTLTGGPRLPEDRTISKLVLTPVIDPKTGMVKDSADNYNARLHNQPEPVAPTGRRARLAEIAGISPDEAAKLFPLPNATKPYEIRDLLTTNPAHPVTSQEDAVRQLVPGQRQDRESLIKNAVLTDAEASFAVYAALGLPFPIRVGKVDLAGTTGDGVVLYSPDLLRADPLYDKWKDLQVTYRFMNNEHEVSRDTVHVQPFCVIPRPSEPVTHLWVSCDHDVMVYALRGVSRIPSTIDEARKQIQRDVVPVNSWLRVPTKLYGIRWGLLPTVNELTKNPATRAKLAEVLNETGLMQQSLDGADHSPIVEEYRGMADKVKASGIFHNVSR